MLLEKNLFNKKVSYDGGIFHEIVKLHDFMYIEGAAIVKNELLRVRKKIIL